MDPTSGGLTLFLGRLHVVTVHFPIALLALAALLEIVERRRPSETLAATVRTLYRFGAAGAVVAAVLGWVHADAEPLGRSVEELLWRHRWSGVASAALALLAGLGASRRSVRVMCGLPAAVLALAAGHFGGQLVYGEDYFREAFAARRESPVDPPLVAVTDAPSFARDMLPFFEAHCTECHGPKKHKGDLRLDRIDEAWFSPGEYATLVERGSPDGSEMMRRLLLPLDDEDHMPPAKEEQLAPGDIELVRRWIESGAKP